MTNLVLSKNVLICTVLYLITCFPASSQDSTSFELSQTQKLLGVKVKEHFSTKGTSNFEDIDAKADSLRFVAEKRTLSGPTPLPNYEKRVSVKATAPGGAVYEGFSGRFGEGRVLPGPGETSSNMNPRQRHGTHLGYSFNPPDVFIGKKENGKIRTLLFFRDVGSHETAPYHFTIDSKGKVHLIVADVNITDNNELNVYSLIGDPGTGKWTDAVVLDRRGFTSWSRPWTGVSGESVHLLWDWGDATYDKENPNMGLFYVEWTPAGYGRKVRVVKGLIESYDAAADPNTGQLLVVAAVGNKVYLASRTSEGIWRRPAEMRPDVPTPYKADVSVQFEKGGGFLVRTSGEKTIERRVRIQ